MAAWFRSNTMQSRSMDSSATPRSARPYIPSDVNGNVEAMMIDMMINEIQTHISRVEDEHEKRRQEIMKMTRTPDYSWLMDWKLKTKKSLSFRECSAIETMCHKVRPSEWSILIREWRSRVRYVESRDDVLGVFRQIVDSLITERCVSRQSVRFVDELAPSANNEEGRPASRYPSPQPATHRSISVAELSVPGLFQKQFGEIHDIV
ncbi:hypothetical protein M3Y97_00694200 [Aphelenchoides bicaudatus]|nr:hypothetical protein M3Y97_00694200 [Aphelenchoides bicaudatus]